MSTVVRCVSFACSILLVASSGLAAQTGTVTGQVVDARTRGPISSAQVSIASLGAGSLTQANGRFLIPNVPAGTYPVQVTQIGYSQASQEVVVQAGETVVVNFTLSEQAIGLDEIVVTGTAGATQRRALGQSVGRIDAAEAIEMAPVRDMQNMLQGRVPGAFVRQASGVLGEGPAISIRGLKSLTLDADPLVYVDGIRVANGPQRLEDLNLAEVESIEVVRGPAAATLYGTEAAAGVVQIITKRGQQGESRFDFQVSQGTMWVPDPASNYRTAYQRQTDGTIDSLHLYRQEEALGLQPFTYGHMQSFQAEASGGTDLIRYYLSGTLDKDRGFIEVNKQTNWAARANVTVVPNERLSMNMNLGFVTSDLGTVATRGTNRTIGGGLWRGRPHLKDTWTRGWPALPAAEQFEYLQEGRDTDKFTASVQVTNNPFEWLEHRLTFGADLTQVRAWTLTPLPANEDIARGLASGDRQGSASEDNDNLQNVTFDYSATGIFDVTESIVSRSSFGLQYYARTAESVSTSGEGFPAPGLSTVGAASERTGSADFTEVSTVGMFAQQEFHWNNRLFLTAAIRADDNSAFGEDFSWVTYPKFSVSWVVSEEPFFNVGAIDQLRLRAAYGASGRQPAVNSALRTYSPETGRDDAPVVFPNSIGNPDLKPERGEELEVGFEASLFQNRVGIDVTAYTQTIKDVIVSRINAPSGGFPGTQRVNAGQVDSKGFEVSLNGQVGASLDLNASVSYVDNKIAHMGGLPPIVIDNHASGPMHVAGFPPGSNFVRRVVSAEFDENYSAINIMCDGGTGPDRAAPGGAPVPCEEAPLVFVGHVNPSWEGSFGGTWRPFDNVSLVAGFGWIEGVTKFNQNRWVTTTSYLVSRENVFPQEFTPEQIADAENGASLNYMQYFFEDASYLRLRELSLNYTLPENFLGTGVSRGSLSVGARNLFTWTPYSGGDPEGLSSGSPTSGGRIDDTGGIPLPASLIFTLRLGL